MANTTYSIDELCVLTDLPKRTIRYYIQLQLVNRPVGETKAAHYTNQHLEQLLHIKRLTDAHVPLERIRQLMQGDLTTALAPSSQKAAGTIEVKTHLHVRPGIELQISTHEAGLTPEQLRQLLSNVMAAVDRTLGRTSS